MTLCSPAISFFDRLSAVAVAAWLFVSALGFLVLGFAMAWRVLVRKDMHWNWLAVVVLLLLFDAALWRYLLHAMRSPSPRQTGPG